MAGEQRDHALSDGAGRPEDADGNLLRDRAGHASDSSRFIALSGATPRGPRGSLASGTAAPANSRAPLPESALYAITVGESPLSAVTPS